MRKIYLVTLALFTFLISFSQTDIPIGSGGTIGNTGTSYPCPLQDYYEGSRAQYLYLASELSSAGMGPGNISAIKFEALNLNTFSGSIEQFTVSIGSSTTGSLTSNSWESGASIVYGPEDYAIVAGTNTLTFTTPYFWNGTDNILVEICNGDPNNGTAGVTTYTQNATVPWTTGLSFNGSHTYRADNLANLCGSATTTNNGTQTTRPDITFSWTPSSTTGCYLPSGTSISNITAISASASWNPPTVGSPAAAYNWELRTSGAAGSGSTGLIASGNTATTTVNFSSLLPSTNYSFYIKSDCGSGNISLWSGGYNFITLCAPIPLFSENFDGASIPNLPLCWSSILRGGTISSSATLTTTTTNAYTTPNAVTMYNSNSTSTDDIILVSPPVSNLSAGTYQLSFYAKNSVLGQDIEVGTLDGNTATANFTPLETVTVTTAYQKFNVSFANYSGTDTYIGLRRLNATTFSYVYLDNINWELIPSCVEPNTLIVSNILSTAAQLDWTPPSSSSPASYEIYYATTSTTPTSSTMPVATGITNPTFNFTSLIPSTRYFVWVRSNCGSGGVSAWSSKDSFLTACVPTSSFTENFDASVTPNLPVCWSKILRGATLSTFATVNTTSTNAYSTPKGVTMYNSSSTSTDDIILVSPPLGNLAAGTYQLSFYAKNSILGQDVEIGTLDDNTTTANFTPLQTVTVTTSYQKFTVSFATYAGTDAYIGLRRLNANTFSYVYLDDIAWELIPSCVEPSAAIISNIGTTSAQIDWTAPATGSPASYEVYVSNISTAPLASTTPNATGITTTTYNFTTLTPASKYFAWVRSNCGAGGISMWARADSFYTQCNATNVPYAENFESATVPALPNCTNRENVGTGNNWVTINNPGSGFTSKTLEYPYNGTNAADVWFYTQGLNLIAGTSYRITFRYGCNSATYTESMNVSYGSNASAASMTDLIVDYPTIKNTTPSLSTSDFTPATSGVFYIGFHAYSISNQFNLFVDDITVDLTPTCDFPNSIVISNITNNSAQLDWAPPTLGNPTNYDLYYNITGTTPTSTTTPSVSGITSTTTQLSGLTPSTIHYVWLRSNCTSSGASNWSPVDTFTTLCDVIPTPTAVTETFSNVIPNCWSNAQGILSDPSTTFTTTSSSSWIIDDFGNATTPVNKSARLNIWNTTTNDWLISPSYNLGIGVGMKLEFDLAYTPYSGTTTATMGVDDKFAVVISTDNGVTWALANALRVWDATTPISNTGEHIVIDLSTYSGVVMFGFYGESTVSNADNNVYVDNVQITPLLPVKLTSFKGERQGSKNLLLWTTATENNSKGFELQRSANGETFSTIAYIASKAINGNSNATLNYVFADEKPFNGNSYYRLKQVDFDGKSSLSNVVLIKGNRLNEILLSAIYPNPTKDKLMVTLLAPAVQNVTLIITDIAGKIVMQQSKQLISGDNNLSLHVAKLQSGTYFIKAVCNNGCETSLSKFVKD